MKQAVMESVKHAMSHCDTLLAPYNEEIRGQSAVKFHEACVDRLTGCCSAQYFNIQLGRAFERSINNNAPLSLLFYSFDNLEMIESRYDRETVDFILRRATQCIRRKGVSDQDTHGRVGENSFGVIFERVCGDQAENIGKRLLNLFKDAPLPYYNEILDLSLSIGIAEVSEQMHRAEILFNQAHISLIQSRQFGGDQSTLFNPSRFEYSSRENCSYPQIAVTG